MGFKFSLYFTNRSMNYVVKPHLVFWSSFSLCTLDELSKKCCKSAWLTVLFSGTQVKVKESGEWLVTMEASPTPHPWR